MTRIIKTFGLLNLKIGGVSGYLPAVFTRRTAESDAWTLHRAISLGNNNSIDTKSESDSNTDGEMAASFPHEDAAQLAHEKSEETYQEWDKYWKEVQLHKTASILNVTDGTSIDWVQNGNKAENGVNTKSDKHRRWMFAMRHGERVDLTYGQWVPFCFDENGTYVRKDLNLPLKLGERAGGKEAYIKDSPLTRVGRFQAQLVGEGMRLAGVSIKHVYSSPALRCVETAQAFLEGLQADPSVKIRVDSGLFEYKMWHMSRGMVPFMTPIEMYKAGLNVDVNYKPYVDMEINTPETLEEYYKRGEKMVQSAAKDTEKDGGNIMFVGHAATLDMTAIALMRLGQNKTEFPPYQLHNNLLRVPYCALGAVRDNPWQVVSPPCPPSINSSSGRYDWKNLLDLEA